MAQARVLVTLDCPIQKVWDTVTDFSDSDWRSDLSKVQIIDLSHFIESTKNDVSTYFTITRKIPYQEVCLTMENRYMKGQWIGKFKGHETYTTLDFLEEVQPKLFLLRPFVGWYLRKQQFQYFVNLKKKLGCKEVGKNQIFTDNGKEI